MADTQEKKYTDKQKTEIILEALIKRYERNAEKQYIKSYDRT